MTRTSSGSRTSRATKLAGVVEAVGERVERWTPGDRVTVPFVCACGTCRQCLAGDHQVCDRQTQPGFHHWGSFAQSWPSTTPT